MAILDKKAFARIRKAMEDSDSAREEIIKKSRDLLKLSKGAIYSVHRNNIKEASQSIDKARDIVGELNSKVAKNKELMNVGAFHEAVQEYVESACYFALSSNKKLPTDKDLNSTEDDYLAGLCDVTGELVRKAINASINGKYKDTLKIKDAVSEIYGELMMFDFRNSPLRRKFDSIKYDLNKLEDLVLQLKLKKKL